MGSITYPYVKNMWGGIEDYIILILFLFILAKMVLFSGIGFIKAIRRKTWPDITQDISWHPYFNKDSWRLDFPAEKIKALPYKEINIEFFLELLRRFNFNPILFYEEKLTRDDLLWNELGHDHEYRYILKDPK